MLWTPFKKPSKRFLGIDIGTTSIKIVELSGQKERIKLENYGEIGAQMFYKKPFRTFEKSTLLLSNKDIAKAIGAIFKEAKIENREAVFSIPDFSTFFTFLDLPPMTQEEISSAVQFKARQHIPLPLSEVVLDWSIIGSIIEEGKVSNREKAGIKVLLVAVPHEVINQYQEIARLSQIRLLALEAEVFGLVRSLIKDKKGIITLVDIGAQSTTISIIENGVLKITYSFDVSGNELTRLLSKSLNISYNKAEELKKRHGIGFSEMKIGRILSPLIDLMLSEIEKISQNFYKTEGKEIEKVILAGGSALLPGLKEYSLKRLKKTVEIANPFTEIFYSPVLEQTLREIGPSYAIAVGMALRGLKF